MASPPDTKPQSSADRVEPHDSDAPPKPRYDEKIEGDSFEVLRRYQEVTLPPNARLKLMSAPVPVVPPEELQDTVPPNARVAAPSAAYAQPPARKSESARSEAPVDTSRNQDTLVLPRVRRKQRFRTVVIGAVVVAVLFAAVGFLLHEPGPDAATTEPDRPKAATAADTPVGAPVAPLVTTTQTSPESAAPAVSVPSPGPSAQTPARGASPSASPSVPSATKAPNKHAGEKLQPSPATTPKPAPAPGKTSDSGSAFDGPMRPPSD